MPRYRTADQGWVRERNLAVVLNYRWEAGRPISRAQLAAMSGLNKSTVSSLVEGLLDWEFVHEVGLSEPRTGRPGLLLDINPDAGRILGAEIGVETVSVVMADFRARVVWRREEPRPAAESPEATLARLVEILDCAMAEARDEDQRLFGIGLGAPGLIERATGSLLFAPNLRWRDVPLREPLARRYGVAVYVDNEANAAALGEQFLGVARQATNVVYVSGGVGLGGGIIIDGKLFGGSNGYAGEIGHMALSGDGAPCACGSHGCWETLVGPKAIVRRVRDLVAAGGPSPALMAAAGGCVEDICMDDVLEAARQRDPLVLRALDEVGQSLGQGIANLVNAFNPDLVVLGGVLSLAGSYVLESARRTVAQRALAASADGLEIKLSAFRLDACLMGGVTLVLRDILANPAAWKPKNRLEEK